MAQSHYHLLSYETWAVMAHGAICRLVCDDICLGYKVIGALPSENLATLWLMLSGVPDGACLTTAVTAP